MTGTDPAANVEVNQVVAENLADLWFFKVTLVTDATVATRTVTFQIQDGSGNVLFSRVSPATQAASLTRNYFFYRDLAVEDGAFDGSGNIKLRLPPMPLKTGYKVVTSTANRQSGDNFGAPLYLTAEYALVHGV